MGGILILGTGREIFLAQQADWSEEDHIEVCAMVEVKGTVIDLGT